MCANGCDEAVNSCLAMPRVPETGRFEFDLGFWMESNERVRLQSASLALWSLTTEWFESRRKSL